MPRPHPRRDSSPSGAYDSLVYESAKLYDIAFNYRDFRQETDILAAWYRRARGGATLGSVLELASGPCAHALELASRGVRAAGIDLSSNMCDYAKKKAEALGLPLDVYTGDMVEFDLDRRFDLAVL